VVKSLKERMAEKREAREASGSTTVTTIAAPRPEQYSCRTCGDSITVGVFCSACRAMRAQMMIERPKPEPPKEKKPVSTSVATNHATRTIEPPKSEKPSIDPERIKAIRKRHGMTQADLAKHLRVSPGSVAYWETSRTSPSVPYVEELLQLEQQAPASEPIADPEPSKAEPEIDSPATVAVAGPVAGEEERPETITPDREELNRRLLEAQEKASERAITIDPPEYPTDPAELAQHLIKNPVATVAVQANVATHVTRTDRPIPLRDDFDAFRLLVRTFGIDNADRIVDLLRA
jgi:transcriptional regulator with XRE-family HTH domain